MKCAICGTETQYNFGSSSGIIACNECAKSENEIQKPTNSKAKLLSFFAIVFFIIGSVLAFYSFTFERNIFLAIYFFLGGLFIMALLEGFAEIIKQLTSLNKNFKNDK